MSGLGKNRVAKTEEEWRRELTPLQYHVTREKGTEQAFTGPHLDNKDKGTYRCVCCQAPLFDSETKYESGSGWPSFYKAIDDSAVKLEEDRSHMMVRTEVMCANCEAHLGHVFPDGPQPTGLRYCMNGVALDFEEEKEK